LLGYKCGFTIFYIAGKGRLVFLLVIDEC